MLMQHYLTKRRSTLWRLSWTHGVSLHLWIMSHRRDSLIWRLFSMRKSDKKHSPKKMKVKLSIAHSSTSISLKKELSISCSSDKLSINSDVSSQIKKFKLFSINSIAIALEKCKSLANFILKCFHKFEFLFFSWSFFLFFFKLSCYDEFCGIFASMGGGGNPNVDPVFRTTREVP